MTFKLLHNIHRMELLVLNNKHLFYLQPVCRSFYRYRMRANPAPLLFYLRVFEEKKKGN